MKKIGNGSVALGDLKNGSIIVTVSSGETFLRYLRDKNVYFKQNGTIAHTARESVQVVRRKFPGRVISLFGHIPRPSRFEYSQLFLMGIFQVTRVFSSTPNIIGRIAIRNKGRRGCN